MIAFGYTPRDFMLGLMGKKGEPTSGVRQMPSHWSLRKANVVSHSSPVGTQTPHASGIDLAIKLRGEDRVVLTSIGEGSASQGEWHEGVNWAAIHNLPVVFLVENNVYAISVHQDQQMAVLGVGAIQKRVIAIEVPDPAGSSMDAFALRPMVYLTLTFDHRMLDGAVADTFLGTIVQTLESWA
jgi:2-oxoisovalerate dehydrogenase E1 component alpha subunit